MRRSKLTLRILLVAVAACLLCCTVAQAKKGGGRGGGGGVIYFTYQGNLYTMNDNGSGIAPVAGLDTSYGASGHPSYALHGNKRWFLRGRGDGVLALSDDGDVVELAVQQEVEVLGQAKWWKDDSLISFVGRLWETDPTSEDFGTIVDGGLYVLGYTIDGDGNLTGSNGPALLVFPVGLVPDSKGDPYPDMLGPDMAPDGVRFVFDRMSDTSLRIGNLSTGQPSILFHDPTDTSAHTALWSPAGDKIAFHRNPDIGHIRIMMINPDGSGLEMLVRGSPNWGRTLPVWSPTGSHLLYHHWDHFYQDSYIIRVTAEGAGKTRMTDKSMGAGFSTPLAIGWRATN